MQQGALSSWRQLTGGWLSPEGQAVEAGPAAPNIFPSLYPDPAPPTIPVWLQSLPRPSITLKLQTFPGSQPPPPYKGKMKQLNALSPLARRTLAPPREAPPHGVRCPSLLDQQVNTSQVQPLSCLHSTLGGGVIVGAADSVLAAGRQAWPISAPRLAFSYTFTWCCFLP